jgi:hypothetical protein
MTIDVPRELESANRRDKLHWGGRHRLAKAWEHDIRYELLRMLQRAPFPAAATTRRAVQITRVSPTGRELDHDNCVTGGKPVLDALKRLGLIKNDSKKWLELRPARQATSTDGHHHTIIEITEAA